jgi:hypothetical protein
MLSAIVDHRACTGGSEALSAVSAYDLVADDKGTIHANCT